MSRLQQIAASSALLAFTACGDDATCGAGCLIDFFDEFSLFAGSASALELELCKNGECGIGLLDRTGSAWAHSTTETSGPFRYLDFGIVDIEGSAMSTVTVWAWLAPPLTDGDTYRLRIWDADSGNLLFDHTEAIEYGATTVCEESCTRGSFSKL